MPKKHVSLNPELLLPPKERKEVKPSVRKRLQNMTKSIARFISRKGSDGAYQESQNTAGSLGLHYVHPQALSLSRRKKGKHYQFLDTKGRVIKDKATIERIRHLAIPPAWKNVRIAKDANAHLQVLGVDARGRTQYRYHPLWRTVREITKFHRMVPFGKALPRIRKHVFADLKKSELSRDNILATVVRLLDLTLIRVGNEEYAKDNHSYGLTTMEDRHVKVRGKTIRFHFRGKSGKMHEVDVHDPRLAKIVSDAQELPGQHLFQYQDEKGEVHAVTSTDINEYLAQITGHHFTAKDFRTWAGTVTAALCLSECADATGKTMLRQNIHRAVTEVSRKLGNTPAVCKKSYVHPLILQSYESQVLCDTLHRHTLNIRRSALKGMSLGEAAVLAFLSAK